MDWNMDCFDLEDWMIENYPREHALTRYWPFLRAINFWETVYHTHVMSNYYGA